MSGYALPESWGTWGIPVRPGTVRVRMTGFAASGLDTVAGLDTTVADGNVRHVECRYNIVELAAARIAAEPSAVSGWQRALREHGRLERAVRRADAPRLSLRQRESKAIAADSRLPR